MATTDHLGSSLDRRGFLRLSAGAAMAATAGAGLAGCLKASVVTSADHGPLLPADANGVQLPAGFTSRIVATTGQPIIFITHGVDEAVTLADRIAVVTNRPGRIKEIIEVDLPRPRSRASRSLPEFQALRDRVWNLLSEEHPERAEAELAPAGAGHVGEDSGAGGGI